MVLGGFLEAPSRKSEFWAKKAGISAPKPDFREKSVFRVKSANFAERLGNSRNAIFFALKICQKVSHLLFFLTFCQKLQNEVKITKFHEITGNLVKFIEICGISVFCVKTRIESK